MKPKVSVCMATYNGSKYIKEQLCSILKQLDKNDELIIADDSSTDDTVKIIKSMKDKRILLLDKAKIRVPSYTFLYALLNVSGEKVFLADQDDIWEDNKVKKLSELLDVYDLVVSDAKVIDGDGKIIRDSLFEYIGARPGLIQNLYRNTYFGCSMAFRRDFLEIAMPFPFYTGMQHDAWLGFMAEFYGRTFFCKEKLFSYRRHGKNVSLIISKNQKSSSSKEEASAWEDFSSKVYLLLNTLLRFNKNIKRIFLRFKRRITTS